MASRTKLPEVTFTHPDKVFFPEVGYTKGQMIRYYVDVAPYLLPHLKDRPITLIRFPDGITGEHFYEKNAPKFTPDWIETVDVTRRHSAGAIHYLLINNVQSLAWCANLAGLEIHPFLHKASHLDQPTSVIFDFDPGEGSDILTCGEAAFAVKGILDELGLEGFPKVSGSKGLQLHVPLNTKVTYASTAAFAKATAQLLEQRRPELILSAMAKAQRRGKVFIDWSQNSQSKTTAAVYSMRAKREEPFISMPVTWAELKQAMKAKDREALSFTPDEAIKRLRKVGDLYAPVLTLKQKLPKAFATAEAPADPLARYVAKRDFSETKEPKGRVEKMPKGKDSGRFVIQKHDASHLHYDFRLEMDGTLKSWAVPKGLPTELGVKRSAFEVEDHPVSYLKFEGTIPKGQYGGGTVMVWDLGTYQLLGGSHREGNLKLLLKGKKLKGEWHMFRIRSSEEKPVWLIAKSGRAATPISARQDDSSVLTRRSMKQIAADNDAQWDASHRS